MCVIFFSLGRQRDISGNTKKKKKPLCSTDNFLRLPYHNLFTVNVLFLYIECHWCEPDGGKEDNSISDLTFITDPFLKCYAVLPSLFCHVDLSLPVVINVAGEEHLSDVKGGQLKNQVFSITSKHGFNEPKDSW